MKKCIVFLIAFFIVVSFTTAHASSIQGKLYGALDKKLEKYDTVDFKNIKGVPTYILNLKGTDLNVIEAYLETGKKKVILYERAKDGKWIKQELKMLKSRYA